MELAQKNILPHVVDILFGVLVLLAVLRHNILDTGQCRKVLDIMKHDLRLAVVPLVVGLCGVCASMKFKVELTIPSHKLESFFDSLLQASEEVVD